MLSKILPCPAHPPPIIYCKISVVPRLRKSDTDKGVKSTRNGEYVGKGKSIFPIYKLL
jgi:hypothetical protein